MTEKLLKELECFKLSSEKVRLGCKSDGGYVIPKVMMEDFDVLYSYGVGDDISFEVDLLNYRAPIIRMYDHTVDRLPVVNEQINFYREGLASSSQGNNLNSFEHHIKKNSDVGKKILLKIDIEEAEYEYFLNTDISDFTNVNGIVLELHNIERRLDEVVTVLRKINEIFSLVHIHGNNYDTVFLSESYVIPNALELVFMKSSLYNGIIVGKGAGQYPITNKDYPCAPSLEDYPLDFTERPKKLKSDEKKWIELLSNRSRYLLRSLYSAQDAINVKDDYIESLKKTLKEKDDYIISLGNATEEKDDYIESLKKALKEKDDFLKSWQKKRGLYSSLRSPRQK